MPQLGFRRFPCQHCGDICYICSCCDHGNRYCSQECAGEGRAVSLALAGARYQRTLDGALNNAERQARHRARRAASEADAQKVTHQSSPVTDPDGKVMPAAAFTCQTRAAAGEIVCIQCGAASPRDLVRLDVLRWRDWSDPHPPPGLPRRPP